MQDQDSVIRELQEHGIRVEFKPVAIVPDRTNSSNDEIANVEMCIYKALDKIKNKITVSNRDPFNNHNDEK